ncbi:related to cercosporin resistance protein [Cephalotrichum gorgonifer]|uniref:Related to cercosporin resistance protein n=1 Tax=Cephalotrichum gorgonifer TaxID=2041049 RepID=A0AAE8SQM3_9PEZI|nr:related to cercosporin resistance protein [Cephalotrichum gorgonifer]
MGMNSTSRGSGSGSGSGVSPDTVQTLSSTPSPAVVESRVGNRYADVSASARLTPPPPPHAAGLEGGAADTHGHHPHRNDENEPSQHAEDAKRSRACEACRGLKVRCEMAEEGPCRRCRKAGRRCVVTVRSRGGERQKKTDTRVADLERKIDALAATLQARGGSEHASASPVVAHGGGGAQRERTEGGDAPSLLVLSKDDSIEKTLLTHWGVTESQAPAAAGQKRKHSEAVPDPRAGGVASRPPNLRNPSPGDDRADIVTRGLITMERAEELFRKYNEVMVPHFPAVVFPPGSTAAKLREEKPILFMAIMAAASSDTAPLQKLLVKELMQVFGDKVIVTGEKSLALVQAIFVSVAWYWPPEVFEELKFYQLAHIGIVMSIDLGLGRSGRSHRPTAGWGGFGGNRFSRVDPETLESRRTWLAAYALSTNMSIGLRRMNLIPWSNFMGKSLEILETSPDAAPTDKYLCQLVRANRIGEEVTTQFSTDNPVMSVNLADVRTQVTLKMLERELEKLKRDTPQELRKSTLEFGWGIVEIYMHEMALHSDDFDNMKGCFPTTRLDDGFSNMNVLTTFHMDSVVACYSAVTDMFETFLAMDIISLRVLPVFNFVRIAYALVVIIKIYFTAASADTEIGKVLPKESIRVDHYIDAVLQKFMAAAAEDKCRPAAKFLVVLVMLRGWLNKKTGADKDKRPPGSSPDNRPESSPESRSGAGGGPRTSRTDPTTGSSNPTVAPSPTLRFPGPLLSGSGQMQQPQGMMGYPPASTANTPLQLLSEVAAGDSSMGGRTSHLGWQNRPAGSGPSPQPFTFAPSTGPALPPMDVMAGTAAGMQWPGDVAEGMGVFFGDNVDWEGMALSFGVGMSTEHEYEIINMMTELNKPWVVGQGMTAEPGGMSAGQGVYYQQ